MSPKKRQAMGEPAVTRNRSSRTPRRELIESRAELRATITKLKALGCKDSTVLVEFWHALDCVNGEDGGNL